MVHGKQTSAAPATTHATPRHARALVSREFPIAVMHDHKNMSRTHSGLVRSATPQREAGATKPPEPRGGSPPPGGQRGAKQPGPPRATPPPPRKARDRGG